MSRVSSSSSFVIAAFSSWVIIATDIFMLYNITSPAEHCIGRTAFGAQDHDLSFKRSKPVYAAFLHSVGLAQKSSD